MALRLLFLPTYFPTSSKPIVGSQVKEQAESINGLYDLKVIYCLNGMGWKRFLIHLLFGKFLKNKAYISCESTLKGGKLNAHGVYYFSSKMFSKKLNDHLRNKAYSFVYNNLIEKGWTADLCYSRGIELGGSIALNFKSRYGMPYVHTENTALLFDSTFSVDKLSLYKNVLGNAKKLMFVSTFLMRNTVMHGFVNHDQSVIIGNSVDEELFYPFLNSNKNDEFRILITGYDSYIKDYDTFFRTINYILISGYRKIKAVIAMTYGNEKSKANLVSLATKYSVLEFCEFHLQKSRHQMPQLINSCDLYLSTSIIETFGIAMLEAMFCGKPVIATKNGGVEDFISEANGALCDIGDYKCLGDKIINIINGVLIFDNDKIVKSVMTKYSKGAFVERLSSVIDAVNILEN